VLYKILDGIYSLRATMAVPDDADIVITNTFWAPLLLPLLKKAKIYVDVARMPKGQMRLYRAAARLRSNSTPVTTAICKELPAGRHVQVGMIPNPLPYNATEDIDFHKKDRNILFCGRVHPEKGLELLAKAANALPQGWTLSIVGPWQFTAGGGGAAYLKTLKGLFDSTKVHFLEPIYDIEKLNVLYKAAAIFVYPSVAEKGETFGLAPLEAMAWGAVPVVSDLACFKDFIVDGENGLIFNHRLQDASEQVAASVLRLIDDQALRHQLGEKALQVRTTHSPDAIADLFLADFERLAA
jgi:glycosyltransferase involved in cell wall biosynthesis